MARIIDRRISSCPASAARFSTSSTRPRIASCHRIKSCPSSPTRAAISPRSPPSTASSTKSSCCSIAGAQKRRGVGPPRAHLATGPNQLWSWDITYLRTPVRGVFVYLYLMLDVWSRKVVGWAVHDVESAECAAALFLAICRTQRLDPAGIVLHADNGGPMKGATMVATLERLGVLASFSRPSTSNDNPFSEALFRTLKYCPAYPTQPFADLVAARAWVEAFVHWYNTQHLHSAIRFVTPDDRHAGRDIAVLSARRGVYARARRRTPARWSGAIRNWDSINTVRLNPEHGELADPVRIA
jgi:putative transposase